MRLFDRNFLAFPGGIAPGFDPSHIAAGSPFTRGISVVARGANFINVLNGQAGTITGTGGSGAVIAGLGQCVNFPSGQSYGINFPGFTTTASGFLTYAFIGFSNTLANGSGTPQIIMMATGSKQEFLWDNISAPVEVISGGGGFFAGASVVQPVGVPYFCVVSIKGGVVSTGMNAAITDLKTGKIVSSISTSNNLDALTNVSLFIGNNIGGNFPFNGYIAAAMYNNSFLSLSQLMEWAVDPWSYWYPPSLDQQQDEDVVGSVAAAIADTTPNYVGKFINPAHNLFVLLRHNIAADFSTASAQPSTPPHFVGKFYPSVHALLPGLRSNIAADFSTAQVQPSTPVNFVGRFTAGQIAKLQLLWSDIAADFSTAQVQPETGPHFIGRFTVAPFIRSAGIRQNYATDVIVSFIDNNQHFIGRFTPTQLLLQSALRFNVASDFSTPQTQPETNVHFVGRYFDYRYSLLSSLRQTYAPETPVVSFETNTNFVGRFLPTQFTLLPALRSNTANDTSTAQVQPETNVHFTGRFTPTQLALQAALKGHPANDTSTAQTQPETSVHFVGRFRPTTYTLYAALSQNSVFDTVTAIVDNNQNFVGRFTATQLNRMAALGRTTANDTSTAQVQPDTSVHFVGHFTAVAFLKGFAYNLRDTTEQNGPPPPVIVGVYSKQFFAQIGSIMGIPGDPPS